MNDLKQEIYNIMDLIDKTNKLFLESYDLMKLEESLGVSDVVIQTTDDLYKTIVNKIKIGIYIKIFSDFLVYVKNFTYLCSVK